MSMPIQRQSESFGIFDDGPRYDRDRPSHDLPRGLAGLVNGMGPRIQAGLLNTRLAVNVDGMDPDDHAYHTEAPYGPGGDWVGDEDGHRSPRREWNPDYGYEPTDEDERRAEGVYDDDESGYNWGPVPPEHLGAVAEDYSEEDDVPSRRDKWNRRRENDIRMTMELLPDRPRRVPRSLREMMEPREGRRRSGRHPFDRAAMRLIAFADWKNHYDGDDWMGGYLTFHKARLENGHELHAWRYENPEAGQGWNWGVVDPEQPKPEHEYSLPGEFKYLAKAGEDAKYDDRQTGGSLIHGDQIDSFDEAKQQAQKHYQKIFPIGTDTGFHDSGVDYSDLNSYMRHLESMRRLAKDGDCTCWEGYERVPGTEPCASKSCRKKSMRQTASWFDGKPDHADVAWGETDEGWEHPVTGCRVRPSSRYLDEWEMVAPTTSKRKPYTVIDHHSDPQAMMDRHDRAAGYGPKTAQMSYEDAMNYIDETLANGENENEFGPGKPWVDRRDKENAEFEKALEKRMRNSRRTALTPQDPAMAPQMPAGGGFQPAHRVGLDWRDSTLRGTVIGVDDQVHVRWDDGQYTSEEPPEIRLL